MMSVHTKRCWKHGPHSDKTTCPQCTTAPAALRTPVSIGEAYTISDRPRQAQPTGTVAQLQALAAELRDNGCGCVPAYCGCGPIWEERERIADEIDAILAGKAVR